jgi:hypothetical protein
LICPPVGYADLYDENENLIPPAYTEEEEENDQHVDPFNPQMIQQQILNLLNELFISQVSADCKS